MPPSAFTLSLQVTFFYIQAHWARSLRDSSCTKPSGGKDDNSCMEDKGGPPFPPIYLRAIDQFFLISESHAKCWRQHAVHLYFCTVFFPISFHFFLLQQNGHPRWFFSLVLRWVISNTFKHLTWLFPPRKQSHEHIQASGWTASLKFLLPLVRQWRLRLGLAGRSRTLRGRAFGPRWEAAWVSESRPPTSLPFPLLSPSPRLPGTEANFINNSKHHLTTCSIRAVLVVCGQVCRRKDEAFVCVEQGVRGEV